MPELVQTDLMRGVELVETPGGNGGSTTIMQVVGAIAQKTILSIVEEVWVEA